jgi:hypothetical protein
VVSTGGAFNDGALSSKKLVAMQGQDVGMQVCWYQAAATGQPSRTGMHLWYASDAQTLQEYLWEDSGSNPRSWTYQNSFIANGHAGIGCYSWDTAPPINYAMMVNLNNDVNVLWKNMNNSASDWKNTSLTIPGVSPRTSLGYTKYFFAQTADGSLVGHNITWASESTSLVNTITIQQKALQGTHFTVTTKDTRVSVIAQQNGSDIVQNIKDAPTQWSYVSIAVPDN